MADHNKHKKSVRVCACVIKAFRTFQRISDESMLKDGTSFQLKATCTLCKNTEEGVREMQQCSKETSWSTKKNGSICPSILPYP